MKNTPKSRVSFYLKSGSFHEPGSPKDTLLAKTLPWGDVRYALPHRSVTRVKIDDP